MGRKAKVSSEIKIKVVEDYLKEKIAIILCHLNIVIIIQIIK